VEFVPLALTAMERHSQNDMLYDPAKAKNLTTQDLKDAEVIFQWLKLPFTTKVSIEDFTNLMSVT